MLAGGVVIGKLNSKQDLNHGTKYNFKQGSEVSLRNSESDISKEEVSNQKAAWQKETSSAASSGKTAKPLRKSGNVIDGAEMIINNMTSSGSQKGQDLQKPQVEIFPAQPTTLFSENGKYPTPDEPQNAQHSAPEVSLFSPPVTLKPKVRLLSAGISLQHPLAIFEQKAVPYGYNAGSRFRDYIPSVWLRFERPKRWFFQGEFIYSAPQLVKPFAFTQQTKPDTGFSSITTVLHMKKTFFHQIPVSFNYYIKPNWSVGAGLGYAWLKGAITERDIIKNTPQGQILAERQLIPIKGFTDSFLHRSHSLVLLQTEYKWKRFSAGIKFTRDLQSFITYTSPDGRFIDRKNSALSILLRFKIWEK